MASASEGSILCVYGDKLVYSGQGYEQGRTFKQADSHHPNVPELIRIDRFNAFNNNTITAYKAIKEGESCVAGETGDRTIDEPILRQTYGEPSLFLQGTILHDGDQTYGLCRNYRGLRPENTIAITCIGHDFQDQHPGATMDISSEKFERIHPSGSSVNTTQGSTRSIARSTAD